MYNFGLVPLKIKTKEKQKKTHVRNTQMPRIMIILMVYEHVESSCNANHVDLLPFFRNLLLTIFMLQSSWNEKTGTALKLIHFGVRNDYYY